MGAAEQQQFSQYPLRYGDGTLGAAIAQTRDGKDELITPVALWELDDSSGLYLPPGLSQNPRRPRVDAQLSGSFATLRPMTGGSMTVASVAAEIAPGTTGRRGLWIRNEEDAIRIRIDGESITDQTGVALEPGETLILAFDPAVFVPVFAISEAGLALIDYNWW